MLYFMRKLLLSFVFIFTVFISGQGQSNTLKTYRVGIFSPLYLDSVFTDINYTYGKNFPRFTQQGLDFVQGAQIALDSMPLSNSNIAATFFDSKAFEKNIPWLISNQKLDSLDLLIGAAKDMDFLQLAAFAKQKNIPFISAVYPNDGGVTANPFLVIVNATLRVHCETIFNYLLQEHGTHKIFLCRRKGNQEDKIAAYFRTVNEVTGKPLLNIQTLNFDTEDLSSLGSKLDSNRKNIIIGGSLGEDFAGQLLDAAYAIKKIYPIELIGMPNWDAFKQLKKISYKDFPVLYTTPYNNSGTDAYSRRIKNIYANKYKGIPSDMTYRGFETVFVFAGLLSRHPDDFMSRLNENDYRVFSQYDFRPLYRDKTAAMPDYFENRHLYFMKIINGNIVKARQ